MKLKHIQVSDSLEGIARVGVAFFERLKNGPVSSTLRSRLEGLITDLRQTLAGKQPSEVEAVARVRKLYRAIGIDPTKDRPSSERLLRRALQGRSLPKVSKLVDAMNLASLRHQCPLGVYDWDRIDPPVIVRIGRPDEVYRGVTGETVRLEGRLVLGDGEGLFGNPSQDSARTKVTLGTVRAMVVAWAPADEPRSYLEAVLQDVIRMAQEFCEARPGESGIL